MAMRNKVTIYSNDGSALLFTSTNYVYQAQFDTGIVTDTGLTINFLTDGYPTETYTYTGDKKLLGFDTSPNQTEPLFAIGVEFDVGSNNYLYIVEGELEEPKITFNITENAEFTLATKGKYCDKDIAVNVAVPIPDIPAVVGTKEITENGTYNASDDNLEGYSSITVNVPSSGGLPTEISTEAEMEALLETAEVGSVYKYTGETGTYENGAYYVLEEE